MSERSSPGDGRPLAGSLGLSLLLLAIWIAIELLASSRWQEIGAIRRRVADRSRPTAHQPPPLRSLLAAMPWSQRRVWFAPYTTYPETGHLESRNHSGVYDTFLTFPVDGLRSSYGAFRLSPADSVFAQASTQGLAAEARLARALGYRWFAVDRGALQEHRRLDRLCAASPDCRRSGDGYALFRLDGAEPAWIAGLAGIDRRLSLLPQISTAPRWGGLVFDPMQWWQPTPASIRGSDGAFRVWPMPLWRLTLYRHDSRGLPPLVRAILAPAQQRVQLVLAPGLGGLRLCIGRPDAMARNPDRCQPLELSRARPVATITPWLAPGRLSTIEVRWIFDRQGLPLPARLLPAVAANGDRPSAFAIEIRPGLEDQLPLAPSP